MKKFLLSLVIILLGSLCASAQTTTVTGTVVDANNNAYSNGTVSAFIVLNVGSPLPSGVPASGSIGPFPLNGSGVFSVTVASPNSWVFGICGTPVNVGPRGNPTPNSVCFSTSPIAISGGSQDITSNLSGLVPLLGPSNPTATVTCIALNFINAKIKDTTCLAGADLGARLNTCNSLLSSGGICSTINEVSTTISTAVVISNPITILACGTWDVSAAAPGITFNYAGGSQSVGGGGLQGCPGEAFVVRKSVNGTLFRISGTNISLSDIQINVNGNNPLAGIAIDPTGSTDTVLNAISMTNLDVAGIQTTAAATRLKINRLRISFPFQAASSGIVLVGGSVTVSNSNITITSGTGDALSATGAPSSITVRDSILQSSGTSGSGLTCPTCGSINITGSTVGGVTRSLNALGVPLTAIGNTFSGGVIETVLIGNNTTPSTTFIENNVGCGIASTSGMGCIHLKGDSIGNIVSNNSVHLAATTPTGNNYCIWLDQNTSTHFLRHVLTGNVCTANASASFDAGYFLDNSTNGNFAVTLADNICIDVTPGKCVVRSDASSTGTSVLRNNYGNNGAVYGVAGSTQDVITGYNTTFANLPNAGQLSQIYCSDCTQSTPTASSGLGSFLTRINGQWVGLRSPTVAIVSGSDYTNATTTFSDVTGLSFAVPTSSSGPTYSMHCSIVWSASAVTAGPQFQITGPTAVTLSANMVSAVTSSTTASAATTTFGSAMNPVGATVTSGVNEFASVNMGWSMGGTSGTIQLQAAAQGAGTLTIRKGSYCQFQ